MKRLRARLSALGDLSFNSDEFNGESGHGGRRRVGMQHRAFRESSCASSRCVHADKLKKPDAEALVAYLASPSPTTVLALEAEKLAKNTRLYKAVAAKHGKSAVIDCAPLKRYELPKTVRGPWPWAMASRSRKVRRAQDRRPGGRGHRAPRQRGQKDRARAPWRRRR